MLERAEEEVNVIGDDSAEAFPDPSIDTAETGEIRAAQSVESMTLRWRGGRVVE